jgi:hypothetical protein
MLHTQNEPGFLLMYASRAAASSASDTGCTRPMSVKRASDMPYNIHLPSVSSLVLYESDYEVLFHDKKESPIPGSLGR